MSEQATPPGPLPGPLERIPRRKQSPWPVIVALALLVLLAVGSIALLFRNPTGNEPWRIPYPGVTWLRGTDANLKEGKRYLEAEVRFDVDVLSGAEFQPFLGELVIRTRNVYFYYHIRALNKRGQWVLDGYADRDRVFSIDEGPDYSNQGGPEIPRKTPGKSPDNAPDESSGGTIIIE